jgi:hypothetical protein
LSAVLILLQAFSALPAQAADKYFSLWFVEPSTISGETLILNEGDFVQKARLLPLGLVEIDSDALPLPEGKPALVSGTQFFEMAGGNPFRPRQLASAVFCEVKPNAIVRSGLIAKDTYQIRYCLADMDRDGDFDLAFTWSTCYPDFPLMTVKIPKKTTPLASLKYRKLDVNDVRDSPTVGIVYAGTALINGKPKFYQAFGSGRALPLFGDKHDSRGDVQGQYESAGAVFTVLSIEGKQAKLRNDRAMRARPFAMFSTGGC